MDRYNIINEYSKGDFMDFLKHDSTGKILELFNEEGINILKNSKRKEERISYMLVYSPYKNELLKNILFLDMFLDTHISDYYAVLNNLEEKTYDTLLKRSIELNKESELISELFNYFNLEYKIKKIQNNNFSQELLYSILETDSSAEVIQKIIDNYNIDLSLYDINLRRFFSRAKESNLISQSKRNLENISVEYIHIPTTMITEEIAKKIMDEYNIFEVRAIINNAEYCTDASLINNYVKQKENEIINKYNYSTLLSPFQEIYDAYIKYKQEEIKLNNNTSMDSDNYYKYRREYLKLVNGRNKENLYENIEQAYLKNGIEEVEIYLKRLSENCLSNYIIDYHFEENYHNIMIDIKELLNFYYNGEINIPPERVELYDKISNIDYLPIEEKLELHQILKQFNMIETFYDDMALARHIVAEAIKEYSLNSETIKQYKDEELSKKYGVDVYNVNGNPFFGIVKTGRHLKDTLPTGHSYSLVGDGGIAVFGDVTDSNTFLYDAKDMNPDQLVHAFPFDSYTHYHPFEYEKSSTRRVNILAMPQELVNISKSYTELLILERGKQETDIDSSIPELKRIALYCIDEIRSQDIEKAKQQNLGIILIDSRKYNKREYRTFNLYHHNLNDFEYNYFDGSFEIEKFEARR